MKFYIYDCNGNKFGNTNGYNRYSDAQRITTLKRHTLWAMYDEKYKDQPDVHNRLIWSIKFQ